MTGGSIPPPGASNKQSINMNFILTITYDPEAPVGISFEGDDNMPMAAIMKGIKTFMNTASDLCEEPTRETTLGDVFSKKEELG